MTTRTATAPAAREPALLGQTVVVIGGSAGIGLETARLARAEGADVILAARHRERLQHASDELGALSTRRSMPTTRMRSRRSSSRSRDRSTTSWRLEAVLITPAWRRWTSRRRAAI